MARNLWSEEGTQWQDGLSVLLEQWLNSGQSLAFPESPGSASRDRREVAPTGLLLSAERLQRLADEIESRLAAQGTWRRRLCDWAIAHPEKGLQRLIKNRVRRAARLSQPAFHLASHPHAKRQRRANLARRIQTGHRMSSTDSILQVSDISLSFKGVKAINALSFDVRRGEICALIGPNGAGKSSLLNVLNGVYRFDAGSIVFEQQPFKRIDPLSAARRGIGRTFQNNALFKKMSVLDNVLTGLSRHLRSSLIEQALDLPRARREAETFRRHAQGILEFLELQAHRDVPGGQPVLRPAKTRRAGPRA